MNKVPKIYLVWIHRHEGHAKNEITGWTKKMVFDQKTVELGKELSVKRCKKHSKYNDLIIFPDDPEDLELADILDCCIDMFSLGTFLTLPHYIYIRDGKEVSSKGLNYNYLEDNPRYKS